MKKQKKMNEAELKEIIDDMDKVYPSGQNFSSHDADKLVGAIEKGADLSPFYSVLINKLSSSSLDVACAAHRVLASAAEKDSSVILLFVNSLSDKNEKVREYAVVALYDLMEKKFDIAPAFPLLVNCLNDTDGIVQMYSSSCLTSNYLLTKDFGKIIDLLRSISPSVRNGSLKIIEFAPERGLNILPLITSVIALLLDNNSCNNEHALVTLENFLKQDNKNISMMPNMLIESKLNVNPEIMKKVDFLIKVAKCEVCKELPTYLSIDVDAELSIAAKKLIQLFWCSGGAGMAGYAFYKCPICGTYYYYEREESLTGVDPLDLQRLCRIDPIETELLNPVLGVARKESADQDLNNSLKQILSGLHEHVYRANNIYAVIAAIMKLICNESKNKYCEPLVKAMISFVSTSNKNAQIVLDEISRFEINKGAPEIKKIIEKCNGVLKDK